MNNLNSILIEGKVKEIHDDVSGIRILLSSYRFEKRENECLEITLDVPVLAFGKLGELCVDSLEPGRVIRVVGRLAPGIVIVAEHIEFKPVFQKKSERRESLG